MDAFYASVEQRDNPDLKGKPVSVGRSSARGVVAAESYEARAYGVKSAMPSKITARKCPDLRFVKARFDSCKRVSDQIREIFYEYTDLVEPLTLELSGIIYPERYQESFRSKCEFNWKNIYQLISKVMPPL